MNLSDNALKVLERRYLTKDEKGNVVETPIEMFGRVATFIAEADKTYDDNVDIEAVKKEIGRAHV